LEAAQGSLNLPVAECEASTKGADRLWGVDDQSAEEQELERVRMDT
jgi:hypothetical protein